MATQLQIVNLALTRLGVPRITALTDAVKAARSATAVWDFVRDEVLDKHSWNRTTSRADLLRVTDAAKIVSGVSAASDAVLTTTKPHGYAVDDVVLLLGVEGCLDSDSVSVLNNLYHTILTVPSATTFSIAQSTLVADATAYVQDGLSLRVRTKRLSESLGAITAITLANPGVVTVAAHGLTNGQQVYLSTIVGTTELNGRYFTVGDTTTNTFELMGINTTTYTAWSSAGIVQRVVGAVTDWDYQYALPTDCLRVLDISFDDGPFDWQVEVGGILMSDAGPDLAIRYIQKITDVSGYDPLLVNALTSRLAAELAYDLTGNLGKKQAAMAEYMGFIEEAKLGDLREQTPTEIEDDTWITERL